VPHFGPISRRNLVRYLQQLGFTGPYSGAKHSFMLRGTRKLRVPNPHSRDIDRDLLSKILDEAGISRDEWEAL